jgi:hypothetical protein
METGTPGDFRPRQVTIDEDDDDEDFTIVTEAPVQTISRDDLDNTVVGEDGMTEYQREHQHDEWAMNLDWPEAQTYEEAGVVSPYIAELVRKNWRQKDTVESIAFWEWEFDEGIKAANEARAQGKELVWVTDPSEIAALG